MTVEQKRKNILREITRELQRTADALTAHVNDVAGCANRIGNDGNDDRLFMQIAFGKLGNIASIAGTNWNLVRLYAELTEINREAKVERLATLPPVGPENF